MRGSYKNQAGQIFRAITRIGESRHKAKAQMRAVGVTGSHKMGQSLGVYSYSTLTKYRRITTEFLQWSRDTHNIKDAAKITSDHVEEWLQVKIASGIRYKSFSTCAAAINKMSVGLKEIYKKDTGWSDVIDSTRKQAKEYCSRDVKSRRYLRPQALIDQLDGIHRIAAELQYMGGARVKEVTVLKDENLVGNNQLKLTNTKGGKVRVIELPPDLYERVNEIVEKEGVFQFDYRSYIRDLKEAALETEQPYNSSHGLRWSYCARAFKEIQEQGLGYDEALKIISNRMGHVRPEITLHYTR